MLVAENDGIVWTNASIDLAKAPAIELSSEALKLGGPLKKKRGKVKSQYMSKARQVNGIDHLNSLEKLGKDLTSKVVRIANHKRLAIGNPSDAVRVVILKLIGELHHVHKLCLHDAKVRENML